MNKIYLGLILLTLCLTGFSQSYIDVKRDSVIVKGELIINNNSKNTQGYLYNTGNGITQFRPLSNSSNFVDSVFSRNDSLFMHLGGQESFVSIALPTLQQVLNKNNALDRNDTINAGTNEFSLKGGGIVLESSGWTMLRNTSGVPKLVFRNDGGETPDPTLGAYIYGSAAGGAIQFLNHFDDGSNRHLNLGTIDNDYFFRSGLSFNLRSGDTWVQLQKDLIPGTPNYQSVPADSLVNIGNSASRFISGYFANSVYGKTETSTDNSNKFATTAFVKLNTPLYGSGIFSGTGSQTTFTITHGLGTSPSQVIVTATSLPAAAPFYISNKTATAFDIIFTTAPVSGSNNISFDWSIK